MTPGPSRIPGLVHFYVDTGQAPVTRSSLPPRIGGMAGEQDQKWTRGRLPGGVLEGGRGAIGKGREGPLERSGFSA